MAPLWAASLALLALLGAPRALALRQEPGERSGGVGRAQEGRAQPQGAAIAHGCVMLSGEGGPRFLAGAGPECAGAAATGSFLPGLHSRGGFGQLSVSTSGAFSDEQQALAGGFLEGWLTAAEIHAHRHNVGAFMNLTSDRPLEWLEEQDDWTRQQAADRGDDAFWSAMRLLHAQMDGMRAGYNARVAHERSLAPAAGARGSAAAGALAGVPLLTRRDFLFMSAVGDLDPLIESLGTDDGGAAAASARWASLTPHELMTRLHTAGRCSAVVRVTPNFSDLLMGHSAWFSFSGMVRIYKHYSFEDLHHPELKLRRMSFSSYPGELSSDDDFYMLQPSGLVVLQTTNSVFNKTLLTLLKPQSVLSWQRARVASFLAGDGRAWTDVMALHNSGTGNNQWIVVDLKLFKPGHELQKGLLWVVEQMPGLVVASDQTGTLERGSWPSYNIPFFPEIYQGSGYPQFVAQQALRGQEYHAAAVAGASYQLAPRAQIFRRDTQRAEHLSGLKQLLRSNDWPDEPFAGGSPLGALCGRGDLDPARPRAYGCMDTKATSWAMAQRLEADAVLGPPHGPHMPPFAWSRSGELEGKVEHILQPDAFAYQFERMTPDVSRWGSAATEGGVEVA